MVICSNCGAKIDDKAVECPFCHALQMDAAEAEYMNNLYKMNNKMDKLDDNAKGFVLKKTLIHVAVTVGCIVFAILIGFITGYNGDKRYYYKDSDEIEDELEWYDANIPVMNDYYDQGEFAKIYAIMEADHVYSNDTLKLWKHYGIMRIYSDCYKYSLRALGSYDNGEELTEYDVKDVFRDALELRNIIYNNNAYMHNQYAELSEADKEQVKQWLQREESFLYSIGITETDISKDYSDIYLYGDSTDEYKEVSERVKVYYQKYKNKN